MLEQIKKDVYEQNMRLVDSGLVVLTWGNVSGFDRDSQLVVIKPSGVDYKVMKPSDMVVVNLEGEVVEGSLRPSSDTPTHIELYKAFPKIGGIVHTHSIEAVAFAQAKRDIPCYGTTHADSFFGCVPCTRMLTAEEVNTAYEKNTGTVIIERFANLDPLANPGVLVSGHGPFTWAENPRKAVDNAIALEAIARMARLTETLHGGMQIDSLPRYVLEKHYFRKHGANAYYGQKHT